MSKPLHLIIPPELEEEMTPAVKAFVQVLFGGIEELEGKVRELEAKVEKVTKKDPKSTPDNSSLPPSSQHPHAKSKARKSKGSQKPMGAQPRHPKHDRDLIYSDQCDQVIELKPETCRRCGQELSGVDSDPLRHQVGNCQRFGLKRRSIKDTAWNVPVAELRHALPYRRVSLRGKAVPGWSPLPVF